MRRLLGQNTLKTTPTVVVAYTRYSDDENQQDASIDDQTRECATCAQTKEWIFRPDLTFVDAGISGETLATRQGLLDLLAAIENPSRGFDGVVIDDTNRLGRNTADVLYVCSMMKFHDVFLYFVNQNLDSRDVNFLQVLIPQAVADEQFLTKLRNGVARGIRGRVLKGMSPGASHYGYLGEIVPDPTRRGSAARPAIKGVRLTVDPVEAQVILQIFDWADQGLSFKQIICRCEAARFPLPKRSKASKWTISAIGCILHNPLYRGRLIWGKTTSKKHPRTGKVTYQKLPESEWTVNEVPELAIVLAETWERVQEGLAARTKWGKHKLGGIGRRRKGPVPLFSGNLLCGVCGAPIYVFGQAENGERTLQCSEYRYGALAKCQNALSFCESVLENSVLAHLVEKVLQPEMLEFSIKRFHERLAATLVRQTITAKSKRALLPSLKKEKRQLERGIKVMVDSLIKEGPSKALRANLDRMEARLEVIEQQQRETSELPHQTISITEARDFVLAKSKELSEILLKDRTAAQLAMRKYVGQLTLTPDTREGLPVFRVSGAVQISSVSQNGMPSGTGPLSIWHSEDFKLKFELIIPARTNKRNILQNPRCSSSEVGRLIQEGKSVAEVAEILKVTEYTVRAVLRALDIKPMEKQRSTVDYLNHPQCKVDDVLRLIKAGKSIHEIKVELGVSGFILRSVVRAIEKSTGLSLKPRYYRPKRVDYLEHPDCPSDVVIQLRKQGLSMETIAEKLGVGISVLQKVIQAIRVSSSEPLTPVGRKIAYTNSPTDYLAHPRCPASEVDRLQKQGLSLVKIASILKVSATLVARVSIALRAPSRRYRSRHCSELDQAQCARELKRSASKQAAMVSSQR